MQKKFKTFAMTLSLLFFAVGEQQAHPQPDNVIEPAAAEAPAPVAENQTQPARQLTKAGAPRGGTKSRKPPIRVAKKKNHESNRKSRQSRYSIAARRLYILRSRYAKLMHRNLVVTSFRRTPAQQARAIRNNIRRRGFAYVLKLYRYSPAIREIAQAYRMNRRNPQQAQKQMTAVIEQQMARGVFVSRHLNGLAADIRSHGRDGARLSVLRDVANEVGAKVSVEPDHFHVRLA